MYRTQACLEVDALYAFEGRGFGEKVEVVTPNSPLTL